MADVLIHREGAVATLTLNRPARRNALSLELMRELTRVVLDTGASADVHAIILAAAGPVFCSGHDLSEMTGRSVAEYREIFDVCTHLMEALQQVRQPVIAQVQGTATAAGCQLVATCDLVVAAESATFATPGVKIGLFCTTPMVALTRAVGRKRALEMLLTGTPVDARTASEWGLVNRVVVAADLERAALELARQIAAASPLTVSMGKQAFYAQIEQDQHSAYIYAREVMTTNALTADAQEGICAFLAKRVPAWSGR
ncbi:MAG: enoyl-CoA hydratase [Bryobacterales bacterium]|nr:enoyl-CoA hydratase [Bryobacterales bacterium]